MVFKKINSKSIWFYLFGFMFIQSIYISFLFAQDSPESETSIKIIVKETSFVKQSNVFLGDIAKINGNGFLKQALEKIELGFSPKPDKIKSFDRKKIISIIQAQRHLPENIVIISPRRIYVKRLSQTIPELKIRQFIENQFSLKNQGYQLKTLNIRGLELYPQGNTRLELDSNSSINKMIKSLNTKRGKFNCNITVIIDGKKEDRLSVSGLVSLYENIVFTKRSFKKGETISFDGMVLKKKNIFDLSGNYIKTFDEIKGKIFKSGIRKDQYLNSGLLIKPPMIQKGDIVTLIAKKENLLIVTSAISMEDGFQNEVIRVENLSSGKLVRGIVKEKSKVEVVY